MMILKSMHFRYLRALAERPRDGLTLRLALRRMSHGWSCFGPGSHFRVIAQLEAAGLIRVIEPDTPTRASNTRRRTYAVTELGTAALGRAHHRLAPEGSAHGDTG